MNKAAVKKYAVAARRKLIEAVSQKMWYYGCDEKNVLSDKEANDKLANFGVYLDDGQKKARATLATRVKKHGFQVVAEEVAYTWFNRLAAIRFMEVNGYLPSGIRILSSSDENRLEPECVRSWERLDFIDRAKAEKAKSQGDEAIYRYILVRQCNELGKIMPGMFSAITDYAELLLPDRLYTKDGIVYDLTHSEITEADFGEQVEIIGWLYQYYISEKKDEVFAALKKNVKITKENVPAATQLFTPDWIVRYMVENSLGRLWLEGHPDNDLLKGWKYYLTEAEQTPEVEAEIDKIRRITRNIRPEEIKLIDPCMGSGHILVYAFDVLYQIYLSQGYAERDIPDLILKNNLFGLDIDERACQLTNFALMMKARSYNRRFFRRDPAEIPQPQVYATTLDSEIAVYNRNMGDFLLDGTQETKHQETLNYLITAFQDIEEYGSLIKLENRDYKGLLAAWENYAAATASDFSMTLWFAAMAQVVPDMIRKAIVLSQKYDVVVTNPPYAGGRNINSQLLDYLIKEYSDSKSDMFSAFIEKCAELTKPKGFQAMITMHSWMFLSSFEKLRTKALLNDIVCVAHLGARAFEEISGEVVQTASFVLRKSNTKNYTSAFVRLVEYLGQQLKETAFLEGNSVFHTKKELFSRIPGSPFAYWLTDNSVAIFENGKQLEYIANPRQGMKTLDNEKYIHFWFEIDSSKFLHTATSLEEAKNSNKIWFPINHGGESRKYYGNNTEVVNWHNDGFVMKEQAVRTYGTVTRTITNIAYYFKEGITWSVITSTPSFRRYYHGHLFSNSGQSIVPDNPELLDYLTGLLNSKISTFVLQILSPTLGFESGYLKKIPIIFDDTRKTAIEKTTNENITLSRTDWDSFETSWDFKRHPLIHEVYNEINPFERNSLIHEMLEGAFQAWERECEERFQTFKRNEEELNSIFIDIYGLQDELTPEVEDKDVTVRRADVGREIRSFISYAVGCMFGRYSLDVEGLAYAGGAWDVAKYSSYIPEDDNILPINDTDYFDDDIVVRFVEFVKVVYGAEWLENNLHFIAETLYPNANGTARDKIRRYFLTDFYKDHIKIYQKKPIYWLFDSGKQGGFKALVYLHRYDKHTVGRVRMEYLHPLQRKYEAEIERLTAIVNLPETSARDKANSQKRIETLRKKIAECRDYDQVIAHIAVQSIELDLDDGVTANYAKFQGVEIAQGDGRPPVKMDLLGKI